MTLKVYFLVIGLQFVHWTELLSQARFTPGDISNMIVCLADAQATKVKLVGTATIISDTLKYYLLTASHVIDSIKGDCLLFFRVDGDKPVAIPLQKFTGGNKIAWAYHPEADICIIEITPYDEDSRQRLHKWHFPIAQILTTKEAVARELNVTVIGFPIVDEVGQHFSPLTFNSYFSSGLITLRRGDTRQQSIFQLLENPSVQGYSGGPVLIGISRAGATLGPRMTVLVGVVHGTFSDNTGGKLAMITPTFYFKDLLK